MNNPIKKIPLKKIFIISALILVFCLTGACVEENGAGMQLNGQSKENLLGDAGFKSSSSAQEDSVSFEDTYDYFKLSADTEKNQSQDTINYLNNGNLPVRVFQIKGIGINSEGKADTWIYGIRYGNNESLIYQEKSWWREANWPGFLPDEEIYFERLITPSEIIAKNKEKIQPLFEKSETNTVTIVLRNGRYYITPENSEDIRGVVFGSYSGEVIENP